MLDAVHTRSNRLTVALSLALAVVLAVTVLSNDADAGGGVPPADGIDSVYIAVGTDFPDSLGVGPGAGIGGAPILIVPTNPPIPTPIEDELIRLDPHNVVIVGGTAVISETMEDSIAALLPNAVISRIAGTNRYDTNAQFSQSVYPIETWVSLGAPDFTANEPSDDDVYVIDGVVNNATDGTVYATIQLPHGAEILTFKARVYDFDLSGNIAVELNRTALAAPATNIAAMTTASNPGPITLINDSINPLYAIVDNEWYAYTIKVTGLSNTDRYLTSVHIEYRLGSP
jgi:hypothetical protein